MYIYSYMYMYTYTHVYTNICVYVCLYIYIYIYMRYVYTYIYIYIYGTHQSRRREPLVMARASPSAPSQAILSSPPALAAGGKGMNWPTTLESLGV